MTFQFEVWDKTLTDREWLGGYQSLVMTPRHNQRPTGALTITSDHHLTAALNTEGARYRCLLDGEFLSSGTVASVASEDIGPEQVLTYQLADDWEILKQLLGWQVPGSAIGSQGTLEHAVYSGPAESVVKAMISANLARLGAEMQPPVTVATDLGRGSDITVQTRMHPMADRLFPLVDQAGIGVTVRQSGSGLVVDCYETGTFPLTLSYAAGTLAGGSWSRQRPTMTRVVVGGPDEKKERVFREVKDLPLEALWGKVMEGYVDARDIDAADPNFEALMTARGDEALAEAAMKVGLSLQLAESDTFRYGGPDGIHVGDVVTAELAPGVEVTDVIREATISDTADDGLRATPVLGEAVNPNDPAAPGIEAARTVHDLAKNVRNRARS